MKETDCSKFQETVDENLIRHRSVLDITSKLQESNARLNRAIAKAATSCGCIKINSELKKIPEEINSYHKLKDYMGDHLEGQLCSTCRETVESELGRCLFYFSALLNAFKMNFSDIIEKEQERMDTFGIYRLS